jgi:translocator protein
LRQNAIRPKRKRSKNRPSGHWLHKKRVVLNIGTALFFKVSYIPVCKSYKPRAFMNQTAENATSHKGLYLLNIAALSTVLYVNYLANALPLNGRTPGELSDLYPNLFVPAGLTFSIWGIIYLWILIWVLLIGKQAPGVAKAGGWFIATCVLNIGWLFAWHWEQLLLSVGVMIALLYCLVRLNQAIRNGVLAESAWEKWTAHLVFGLYQGWITVALIANVTALLVGSGWKGGMLSESDWAIIMVEVGAALAVFMVWRFNHLFHGVAVIWALYGIYLKRMAEGDGSDSTYVAWAAIAGMALVAGFVVLHVRKWWSY